MARVECIAFDYGVQDLVLRCRLLFRGLEVRNHANYPSRTPLREQIFISDTVQTIKIDAVIRRIGVIEDTQITGYYLQKEHAATAFSEPSSRYIREASALPPHCSKGQTRQPIPTGNLQHQFAIFS